MSGLTRSRWAWVGNATSLTSTFMTTPIATSLLVAVFVWASGTPPTTPSGWTLIHSGTQMRVYARQADGVVNSVTQAGAATTARSITFFSFSGFTSVTPLLVAGLGTALTSPAALSPPSTPAGYGVAIPILATPADVPGTWGIWTNGFQIFQLVTGDMRQNVGCKEYTGPSGSYSSTISWPASTPGEGVYLIMGLTPPTPPLSSVALGDTAVSLALGSTPVTGILGAGPT